MDNKDISIPQALDMLREHPALEAAIKRDTQSVMNPYLRAAGLPEQHEIRCRCGKFGTLLVLYVYDGVLDDEHPYDKALYKISRLQLPEGWFERDDNFLCSEGC